MSSASSVTPGPLNPGNVVSAAFRLYRDRFKTYLKLSVIAFLWLFVPIYGWAKYSMYTGLMARMAFQDVTNHPETPTEAREQVEPKLWSFFGLALLLVLIFIGAYIGSILVGVIAALAIGFGGGAVLSALVGENLGVGIAVVIATLVAIAVILLGLLWVVGRLFVAEVPLAVETGTDASASIGRSWKLTKRSIIRIQFVVLAAYLVTVPVLMVMSFIPQIGLAMVEFGSPTYWAIYAVTLVLGFLGNMFTLPFWQAVKGVLYYDLRSRREGLDLTIEDSPV